MDNHQANERLIAAYDKEPAEFYRTVCDCTAATYFSLGWYVTEDIWYVPAYYSATYHTIDLYSSKAVVIDTAFGHCSDGIKCSSIGVQSNDLFINNVCVSKVDRLTNLTNLTTNNNLTNLTTNNYIIMLDVSIIPSVYIVIVAYVNKLQLLDYKRRTAYKQTIELNNICSSVKTPLNGILTICDSLLLESASDQKYNNAIQALKHSSVTLANNIFDVIDIAQLEHNRIKIYKEVFDVIECIDYTIRVVSPRCNTQTNIIRVVDSSVPQCIYTDHKRLKQILITLLENAAQHTTTGEIILYVSALLIDSKSEDNLVGDQVTTNQATTNQATLNQTTTDISSEKYYRVTFVINDPGKGMSEETAAELFKPVEIYCNKQQQGMSLRVSYLLAKKLNGCLSLTFSKLQIGSCFTLEIDVPVEEPKEINCYTMKALRDKRVLIYSDKHSQLPINLLANINKYQMVALKVTSVEEVAQLEKIDIVVLNLQDYYNVTPILKYMLPTVFMICIEQLDYKRNVNKYINEYCEFNADEVTYKMLLLQAVNR